MAKGSHATYGGWEPRTCCICGDPIVLSRQDLRFDLNDETGVARSWHVDCERAHGWPLPAGQARPWIMQPT